MQALKQGLIAYGAPELAGQATMLVASYLVSRHALTISQAFGAEQSAYYLTAITHACRGRGFI